jgi:thymidylate synthase ThyX
MSFQPTASIIGDAINIATGTRLTTFEVEFHRFVLAEFNTHRMISRNSASSRAIPVSKLINKVREQNVEPTFWGKQQKGMQAEQQLDGLRLQVARVLWGGLRFVNVAGAYAFAALGVHKQIANRVIEPYSTVTMIVSATEWQNFFALRAHADAQPEIAALAYKMQELYHQSEPQQLEPGEWYMPSKYDIGEAYDLDTRLKAAVGKIARVSYLTHEGTYDVSKDIQLFNRLVGSEPRHASPLEHVALAVEGEGSGNFQAGWKQLRHIYKGESLA